MKQKEGENLLVSLKVNLKFWWTVLYNKCDSCWSTKEWNTNDSIFNQIKRKREMNKKTACNSDGWNVIQIESNTMMTMMMLQWKCWRLQREAAMMII